MPLKPKKKIRGVKGMSYARLVDEIAKKLQKLVRLKAADENGMVKCWTSGESRHWKEMQGGHFISRKHQRTKIMEENIHPQTPSQNLYGMKDSLTVLHYRQVMCDFYGKNFVEWLEKEARIPLETPRPELEDTYYELVKRCKELEAKIGSSQLTREEEF
jgi:hypothetical protein|tara:strand:+ start:284 stop:760 length:477 start_codon:yes stop_codon:yes gene_type:complete